MKDNDPSENYYSLQIFAHVSLHPLFLNILYSLIILTLM